MLPCERCAQSYDRLAVLTGVRGGGSAADALLTLYFPQLYPHLQRKAIGGQQIRGSQASDSKTRLVCRSRRVPLCSTALAQRRPCFIYSIALALRERQRP
eukprot:6693338-Pyramimonas_sp.AAC.1